MCVAEFVTEPIILESQFSVFITRPSFLEFAAWLPIVSLVNSGWFDISHFCAERDVKVMRGITSHLCIYMCENESHPFHPHLMDLKPQV